MHHNNNNVDVLSSRFVASVIVDCSLCFFVSSLVTCVILQNLARCCSNISTFGTNAYTIDDLISYIYYHIYQRYNKYNTIQSKYIEK